MTQPPAAAGTKDEKGAAEANTTHTPHLTASTSALFFLPFRLFFLLPVLQAPARLCTFKLETKRCKAGRHFRFQLQCVMVELKLAFSGKLFKQAR
jgi:hypothetical protein